MSTPTTSAINSRKLLTVAPAAGIVAAIINAGLFLIGRSTGAVPADLIIPNAGQPLSLLPVLISSFVPALVAGLLLALLNRFTKRPRPMLIFNLIAGAFLVFSFVTPFSIPNVPTGMIIVLELMHIVVAGVIVVAFNRYLMP